MDLSAGRWCAHKRYNATGRTTAVTAHTCMRRSCGRVLIRARIIRPRYHHHQQQSAARGRPFFQSFAARHGMARRGRRPRAAIEHQYVLGGRVGLVSFSWESGFWRPERTAYVSRPAGLGPHTYTYHTMRVLLGLELKKKIPREHTYCTVRTHPCNSSSLDVRLHAPLFCCLSNPLFWLLASFSRGTRITAQTNHRVHVKRASVSLRARPSAGAGERARRAARVCDRFIGSFVYLN